MKRTLTAVAAGVLAAAGSFAAPAQAEGERIIMISHAPDGNIWWNTVRNAIALAGEQMNVTVEYRNPPTGDLADMARLVQQAAAQDPAGIIVSIADFDVLKGPITEAVDRGVPVITINSGNEEQSRALGALMHVGQPEFVAGYAAGQRAREAGVTAFLCVNHFITNPVSTDRCRGFAEGLGVEFGNQMIDSGHDPSEVQNRVMAFLQNNPDTDGILTLGPTSAHPTLRAVEELGLAGDIFFGTFDLSENIAAAIEAGTIAFAIDQQPFLQGYLPVVVLTNLARFGVVPGNSINSGPGFITVDNLDLVREFAGRFR